MTENPFRDDFRVFLIRMKRVSVGILLGAIGVEITLSHFIAEGKAKSVLVIALGLLGIGLGLWGMFGPVRRKEDH